MDGAGGSANDDREDPTLALVAVQDVRDVAAGSDVTLEDPGMYLLKGSTTTGGCWRSHGLPTMVPSVTRGNQLPAVGALLRLGLSRIWWRIASNERVLRHPQAHELDGGKSVAEDSGCHE
jgi:hypothetical protein